MTVPPPLPIAAVRKGHANGRGGLCGILFLCLLLLCTGRAKAYGTAFSEILPYGGHVDQHTVVVLARAAAYLKALRNTLPELETYKAARFGASSLIRREALSMAVYRPMVSVTSVSSMSKEEKNAAVAPAEETDLPSPVRTVQDSGAVRVDVRMEAPPQALEDRVRDALPLYEMLDLRELLLVQMRYSVEEGLSLAQQAAQRRQERGGEGDLLFAQRLQYLGRRLEALWILEESLTRLRAIWRDPAFVAERLDKATDLDPRNPLLWATLGEVQLQQDLPQKALQSLNTAVSMDPDMSRAFYARGLAHLRLQQSALAVLDMDAALRLSPQNRSWLRARGVVRMIREDFEAMCEDFEQACALGDCEGLVAARRRGLCLPISSLAGGEKTREMQQ